MWLPKDERKLPAFYYQNWAAGRSSFPFKKTWDEEVHRRLRDQELIVYDIAVGLVSLTPKGKRLGRKFNSKIETIGVWCAEYMWLFVVLGAIIGAVTLVVTIFKN
jgi:hypothetical protein